MVKIKKRLIFIIAFLLCAAFLFSSCGNVTPCAWVYLKTDGGYVSYTSDMYAQTGSHVYYFKNAEDASDKYKSEIDIIFYPRILGPDNDRKIDGVPIKTTTVDISSYCDMSFTVKKDSEIYSAEKSVYLNGEKITPTRTDNLNTIVCFLFQNFPLKRGNPNGKINDEINVIEYR